MKNERHTGHSARRGNAPAPYTKFKKAPFLYSALYQQWYAAMNPLKTPNRHLAAELARKHSRQWLGFVPEASMP